MRKLILVLLAFAVIGMIFIYSRKKDDDPRQFNKILNEMVHAANAKDIGVFMDFFSLDYKDPSGISYPVVKNIVKNKFEEFDSFETAYEEVSVSFNKESDGDQVAKVEMEIIVTGVKDGALSKELIGGSGHFKYLTAHFRKSGFGFWKIYRIDGLDEPLY